MNRFVLASLLLLGSLRPALAQRVVTQTASLAAGQGVFLDLKYAHHIRVRPGAQLRVQASVSINDNQNNDAYELTLTPGPEELRVVEKLDPALRNVTSAGKCPDGSSTFYGNWLGGDWNGNQARGVCLRLDYDVTLPAGTALRVSSISGDLDVSGLRGPLTLKTISGDLKLADLGQGPVNATSVSGNVDLAWPPAQAAELSLKSISGEVYADPAVSFSNLKARSYVGYQLHGSYGQGGGPQVRLESVSGDVFFRKQP